VMKINLSTSENHAKLQIFYVRYFTANSARVNATRVRARKLLDFLIIPKDVQICRVMLRVA
jgi:hypothetical protein